jgi:sugar phosphate isomerase/epimerase
MKRLSRREFGYALAAAVPVMASPGLRAAQVVIGVSTASFRDLPRIEGHDNVDDVIRAVQAVRATDIDLAFSSVEPAPPSVAPVMGGSAAYPRRVVLTPEQVAATNVEARNALRNWRRTPEATSLDGVRRKLAAAGLTVHACSLTYDSSFTDEEIIATFKQAAALGAKTISTPLTLAMADRLVPFVERHGMTLAIQTQADGNAAGEIDVPTLDRALDLSRAFRVKLDVGAALRKYESRVACVLVKDRLRNGGASQPFGEGDAPIRAVMDVLKQSSRTIPALVEYDYVGLRSSVAEVTAALEYLNASR